MAGTSNGLPIGISAFDWSIVSRNEKKIRELPWRQVFNWPLAVRARQVEN
jgi:hypothetical protein